MNKHPLCHLVQDLILLPWDIWKGLQRARQVLAERPVRPFEPVIDQPIGDLRVTLSLR